MNGPVFDRRGIYRYLGKLRMLGGYIVDNHVDKYQHAFCDTNVGLINNKIGAPANLYNCEAGTETIQSTTESLE